MDMDKSELLRRGLKRVGGIARENIYLKTGVDVTLPESIQCEVIERCNYKCRYCHFWRMKEYADEMTLDEWQRALLSLKSLVGRPSIRFVGGEPFMQKWFVDLLGFCHAEGIDWGVITNGSILGPRVVRAVVAAHPSHIDISVDSAVVSVHDYVRGRPGSLAAINDGIAHLVAERSKASATFPIRIKPTVTRLNFRSLPGLVDWAAQIGADSVDLHPVHLGPYLSTPAMRAELLPSREECEEMRSVMEALIVLQAQGAPIETAPATLRSFPDQFLGQIVKPKIAGPCRTAMRDFIVRANGDTYTCWEYPPIGNVRNMSASEIWRGAVGKDVRKQTLTCPKLGKDCANSCLDHRSLPDEVRRGIMFLRHASPT
jgi:MoaA/NifB/PqqE/SkfB family radical SAM enzyme